MVKSLIRKKQRVSQFVLRFRIPVLIGLYFFSAPASAYLQNSYFESTTLEVQKPQSTKFKFNGEYGLWVREHENQIEVNWITTEEDSGFLKVFKNGIQLYDVITESARSHRAAFDAIEESVLALQYGNFSSQADRHETIIELNKKETKKKRNFPTAGGGQVPERQLYSEVTRPEKDEKYSKKKIAHGFLTFFFGSTSKRKKKPQCV